MPSLLQRTIPVLRTFYVAKAREFYIDYLGFKVEFEHRFYDNAPLFMGISRDGLMLYLSEHHGDGSPGVHVIVETAGVDDLLGTRELGVVDPSGNKIYFSERKRS